MGERKVEERRKDGWERREKGLREQEGRKEYLAGLCVGRRDTVSGYHSEGEEWKSFTV